MDMVEDLEKEKGDGDSVSEEALLRGLMLAWEEEDCRDAVISSGRDAGMPVPPAYPSCGSPWAMPYYGGMAYPGAMPYGYAGAPMGAEPYAPQMTRKQELDFLRSQAEAIKGQLEQVDARIKELETE